MLCSTQYDEGTTWISLEMHEYETQIHRQNKLRRSKCQIQIPYIDFLARKIEFIPKRAYNRNWKRNFECKKSPQKNGCTRSRATQ